jgi:hypothetical protein
MSAFRKYDSLYSEAEARICLTCTEKRCQGTCDRLKAEKKRLYEESLPKPLYEVDEEFVIPDESPWPKKNPYINKTEEDKTDGCNKR